MPDYLVGLDPGGENAFGWAVLECIGGAYRLAATGTETGVPAVFLAIQKVLPEAPVAVGIDAPLFWVAAGDRLADQVVRRMVCAAGGSSGTVSHVNSLRGACLVQGVLAAIQAHKQWPTAQLTESHPKALLLVSAAAREFAAGLGSSGANEHERDAALAAYSANALVEQAKRWHDLVKLENSPFFPAGAPAAYWFPDSGNKSNIAL
ncbi:MAG: DUF429 domain-containing protein [Dechloromonas sp.]|nr:MAG: DUF429 domain-containing protein [Dechloromonas sp.]